MSTGIQRSSVPPLYYRHFSTGTGRAISRSLDQLYDKMLRKVCEQILPADESPSPSSSITADPKVRAIHEYRPPPPLSNPYSRPGH